MANEHDKTASHGQHLHGHHRSHRRHGQHAQLNAQADAPLSTAEITKIQQALVKEHLLDKDKIKLGTWDASSNDAMEQLVARAQLTKAYEQAGGKIEGVYGQKTQKAFNALADSGMMDKESAAVFGSIGSHRMAKTFKATNFAATRQKIEGQSDVMTHLRDVTADTDHNRVEAANRAELRSIQARQAAAAIKPETQTLPTLPVQTAGGQLPTAATTGVETGLLQPGSVYKARTSIMHNGVEEHASIKAKVNKRTGQADLVEKFDYTDGTGEHHTAKIKLKHVDPAMAYAVMQRTGFVEGATTGQETGAVKQVAATNATGTQQVARAKGLTTAL
jgi:hypothetical protein